MTTPRLHSTLAILYFTDDTMKCWVRNKGSNDEWTLMTDPRFTSPNLEYFVSHEPPPPTKRTVTLVVNDMKWVLPEPLRQKPSYKNSVWAIGTEGTPVPWNWYDYEEQNNTLAAGQLYATEADAQAWADFNKWCRRGSNGN